MSDTRVLRIPLPAALIRDMDDLIAARAGGLESRAALAREAIEAMVLELQFGVSDSELEISVDESRLSVAAATSGGVAATSLPVPADVSRFVEPSTSAEEPMFGLHNRDYPSLWAAFRLCDLTKAGPVSFDPMLGDLIGEAWEAGERLMELDDSVAGKPSALFPTNSDKRQAAGDAFANFAVGSLPHGADGKPRPTGPLFDWKVLGVVSTPKGDLVGMTEIGRELLVDMAGLTVSQPHPPEFALRFLDHVAEHAPGDWSGFVAMMKSAADRSSRPELIEAFSAQWTAWTPTEAATNAAGYIARGREWGLVAMKQIEGRYALTDLGERVLAGDQG